MKIEKFICDACDKEIGEDYKVEFSDIDPVGGRREVRSQTDLCCECYREVEIFIKENCKFHMLSRTHYALNASCSKPGVYLPPMEF